MKTFKNLVLVLSILSFVFSFYNQNTNTITLFSEIHLHGLAFSLVFFLCYKGLKHVIKRESKQAIR